MIGILDFGSYLPLYGCAHARHGPVGEQTVVNYGKDRRSLGAG